MKKNNTSVFQSIFSVAFFITMLALLTSKLQIVNAMLFVILGGILTLTFIFIGIREVMNSSFKKDYEKIIWILGFILFSYLTGLLHLLKTKKLEKASNL
jgi:hypothetical protein